jgi:pimeloyl-ACP methyl ester carboxylesterase
MKMRRGLRAIAGVVLCVVGFVLARVTPYRQTTVIIDASGCRMVTDILDKGNDDTQGSVVLLHGLSANKKIMSYLARGFAEQNLRVFVPDLPGHGRTPGSFSPGRAEACSELLLRQLIGRRAVDPKTTILAGHSMGGAIAIRVASRVTVAGVVAISPAPMRAAHGVLPEALLYSDPPSLPANTLVISGSLEPETMRGNAQDLFYGQNDRSGKHVVIPYATHVSLLFDSRAVRESQEWAARNLGAVSGAPLPSLAPLLGSLGGFFGLLLLAGPFLRETVGKRPALAAAKEQARASADFAEEARPNLAASARVCAEVAAASAVGVLLLRFWNPLRFVRVFEGDYLASFLLVFGIVILLWHHKGVAEILRSHWRPILGAAAGGIILHVLFTSWLDLTLVEAPVTVARLLRFPVFLAAVFPSLAAEELLLAPWRAAGAGPRLGVALLVRLTGWAVLVGAIFVLHSGEILVLLLALYLAFFCLLQRAGMHAVYEESGSAMAAAVFGAILLAGFCLVIFPIT